MNRFSIQNSILSRTDRTLSQNRISGNNTRLANASSSRNSLFSALGINQSSAARQTDTAAFTTSGNIGLKSMGPNANKDVANAWEQAASKTGVNGSNSEIQLSAMFALHTEHRRSTGNTDLLGKTKDSAVTAVKKAISRLEGQENERVTTKVREDRKKEMEFYKEFLDQLVKQPGVNKP